VKYEDFWPGERRNTEDDYPRQRSQDTVSRHMAERAEQVRDEEITRLRTELAEARKVVGLLVEACEARVVQCKNDTKFCRWHVLVGDRIYSRNPSRHKATESLYWNIARAALDAARGRVGEAKPGDGPPCPNCKTVLVRFGEAFRCLNCGHDVPAPQ